MNEWMNWISIIIIFNRTNIYTTVGYDDIDNFLPNNKKICMHICIDTRHTLLIYC
jgi:hypothetical protein